MASITELVKNIRNAILGKDVRESIAASIEQCYEDAAKGENANMEVAEARGAFETLRKRLDNNDENVGKKRDKSTAITMSDLGKDVKEAMTGGSVAIVGTNAVDTENIKDKAVSASKTTFISIGKNKFNYEKVEEYMTIGTDGKIIQSQYRYLLTEKIYLLNATDITVSYVTTSGEQILLTNAMTSFYDSKGEFIEKLLGAQIKVPTNAYYCYCLIGNESYAESDARQRIQLEFSDKMTDFEKYYEELNSNILINNKEINEKIKKSEDSISELQQKMINIKDIQSKIVLREIKKIKLIGDSITQGVGGTGFTESYGDGDVFLIVDELDTDQGGRKFKVNTTGYCWANLLKKYLEDKFKVTVSNWGNRGMSAGRWMNMGHRDESGEYKNCIEQLIEENDDLIICMIGTNDRTYDTYNNYINAMQQLINYITITRNKKLVLVSSIPASIENETNGKQNFHMEDVDNIITALAGKNKIFSISLYRKMMQYCSLKNIEMDNLLTDGLHPNDNGYEIMFKLICGELEIAIKRNGATW